MSCESVFVPCFKEFPVGEHIDDGVDIRKDCNTSITVQSSYRPKRIDKLKIYDEWAVICTVIIVIWGLLTLPTIYYHKPQTTEVSSKAADEQPIVSNRQGETSSPDHECKVLASTPPHPHTPTPPSSADNSEGEYTDIFDVDEDYDGPIYVSQPCYTGKHGAPYTPPGWKRKRVKRIKLMEQENDECSGSEHEED